MQKILVTSALPYANGPLHLGHLVEHIQTDIFVRAMKLFGYQCISVCGDDAHGTPIMLKAKEQNITPEALIQKTYESHIADFNDFFIHYDSYHTTHSEENQALAGLIYQRLKDNGDITRKTIKQAFDPVKEMFLPDRYVKGTCPKCSADDQYGDACEACGATYSPSELKDAVSVLSGAAPVEKESEHLFFNLPNYEQMLKDWTKAGHLQPQVANKLDEWFEQGLRAWDISRDAPYFGFEIPGEKDKYFYVWLDAPIGYIASFKKFCQQNADIDFDEYWGEDSQTKLYHFIGKDIIYFHALFWPAMLSGSGFRTPSNIFAHGFLTINGEKMSKSRGTFIKARSYLTHLSAEYLRYYFAAKLSSRIEDIDLNMEDFQNRVNADLVGKVVNIASRSAGFIKKRFDGKLSSRLENPELFSLLADSSTMIADYYQAREFSRAVRHIMSLADKANQYIDEKKPWQMIKDPELQEETHDVCTMALNLFRLLVLYLKPILPELAQKTESFLNIEPFTWEDRLQPLLNHPIHPFKPMMSRVEKESIDAILEEEKKSQAEITVSSQGLLAEFPLKEEITIDDFAKLDLRVAEILKAESVEGADKLLRLQVDIGGQTKQVFAGIKAHFEPESLIGKLTVVLANLKPRKMRFGLSEGMCLLAGDGKELYLLSPESGAKPGMPIK